MKSCGRILFAAPSSGSGKTTITCGVLALLKKRGLRAVSFKCGPDYIDPMFHRQVLGLPAGNLDTFFTEPDITRYLLAQGSEGQDIAVIEGVMGYYDGLGGSSVRGSTYETACVTDTPVVLVVDGRGASVSLAAMIGGMISYRPDSRIRGVILNRVSAGYYERLKALIQEECGIPVYGYLPQRGDLSLPSRHLGLLQPEELADCGEWVERLSEILADTLDLDGLIALSEEAPPLQYKKPEIPRLPSGCSVRIAVARDEAFSFYYEENLSLLKQMGAELVPFSPLRGESLPEGTDALLLGGGYPERYVEQLEKSASCEQVRRACGKGMPCLAECGGFLYLMRELVGEGFESSGNNSSENIRKNASENSKENVSGNISRNICESIGENNSESTRKNISENSGNNINRNINESNIIENSEKITSKNSAGTNVTPPVGHLSGVLSGRGYPTGGLCRFGYVELSSRRPGVLGEAGETIRGHEFHHWDSTDNGEDFLAVKPGRGPEAAYPCMHHTASLAAGFPHLYYYSNPKMIFSFVENALRYRAKRLSREHWDGMAKPLHSLGLLEEAVEKLCFVRGTPRPGLLGRRALLILCGDHGVVREGVTQTGSEVTRIVSENFARGCSTVNYMARTAGADVYAVDVGIDGPAYPEKELVTGSVVDRKVMAGTGDLAVEPAMTAEQCRRAMEIGCGLVGELKEKGYGIVATGEMGIGNTTPASVLTALFLGLSPEETVGRGAGLSDQGLARKREVAARAVKRVMEHMSHQENFGAEDAGSSALQILAQAGGCEIAGMAGAFLGAVRHRIPVVIDGAISAAAALAAYRMDPRVRDYCLASHCPEEPAGRLALEAMGLKAPLCAGMCLGEGTGAVALFPLLDMALEVYENMGSFADYRIAPYENYEEP